MLEFAFDDGGCLMPISTIYQLYHAFDVIENVIKV
jgi:hypothetical protein